MPESPLAIELNGVPQNHMSRPRKEILLDYVVLFDFQKLSGLMQASGSEP